VDRSECVNLNELFERMTREELEAYARRAFCQHRFRGLSWFFSISAEV